MVSDCSIALQQQLSRIESESTDKPQTLKFVGCSPDIFDIFLKFCNVGGI